MWRQADRYRIPRIAFINKCDREGAEPARVIDEMQTPARRAPIAIQLPLGDSATGVRVGVIDLITMRARTWDVASFGASFTDGPIPHDLAEAASRARDAMIEAIAEHDDELMAAWVAGRELSRRRDPRRAAPDHARQPRRAGAGRRGVQEPRHPQPARRGARLPAVAGRLRRDPRPRSARSDRRADPGAQARPRRRARRHQPLAALAFKVQIDDAGGQLTFVRVYAGCLRVGDAVLNATKGHLEQIGRLVRMFANHREDIKQIEAGMIGAVVVVRRRPKLATGDTLCDPRAPILLDAMRVPSPVMGVVIEPETDDDVARVAQALERIAIEDPSFRVATDPDSGQIVISGMGELHLEIIVERMRREFGVKARVGNPQVAYRETVTRRGEGEHKLMRASSRPGGPRGEYGHVQLVVEPTDRGGGYVYENRASDQRDPAGARPGGRGRRRRGRRARRPGRPPDDRPPGLGRRRQLSPCRFKHLRLQGRRESRPSSRPPTRRRPTVLEPVMALEVVTPDEHVGEVLGDLHARRGKVAGITARPGVQTVACFVPMASMFGYATDLRNRTRGRATYSMELDHYAEVPQQLRDDLIASSGASGA